VLRLLADRCSTKEIADELVCAHATARNHVQAVLTRLDCHSRLAAVIKAQRLDLV